MKRYTLPSAFATFIGLAMVIGLMSYLNIIHIDYIIPIVMVGVAIGYPILTNLWKEYLLLVQCKKVLKDDLRSAMKTNERIVDGGYPPLSTWHTDVYRRVLTDIPNQKRYDMDELRNIYSVMEECNHLYVKYQNYAIEGDDDDERKRGVIMKILKEKHGHVMEHLVSVLT